MKCSWLSLVVISLLIQSLMQLVCSFPAFLFVKQHVLLNNVLCIVFLFKTCYIKAKYTESNIQRTISTWCINCALPAPPRRWRTSQSFHPFQHSNKWLRCISQQKNSLENKNVTCGLRTKIHGGTEWRPVVQRLINVSFISSRRCGFASFSLRSVSPLSLSWSTDATPSHLDSLLLSASSSSSSSSFHDWSKSAPCIFQKSVFNPVNRQKLP